jgi:hypothetical protein
LQARQDIKQESKVCEWCGKFIVLVSAKFPDEKTLTTKAFDFYVDEMGRLVRDENELFLISREHKCKVTCSRCGRLVIIHKGELFERNAGTNGSVFVEIGKPHNCKTG